MDSLGWSAVPVIRKGRRVLGIDGCSSLDGTVLDGRNELVGDEQPCGVGDLSAEGSSCILLEVVSEC